MKWHRHLADETSAGSRCHIRRGYNSSTASRISSIVTSLESWAEPIPDGEIEALRRLVATEIRYDPHPMLSEGMLVEVIRGPLKGVRGQIERKDRTAKLVLAVTLIRQAVALEVHPADVTPV